MNRNPHSPVCCHPGLRAGAQNILKALASMNARHSPGLGIGRKCRDPAGVHSVAAIVIVNAYLSVVCGSVPAAGLLERV